MHYFTLVLVPRDAADVASEAARLLDPYGEKMGVVPCTCQSEGSSEPCSWCDGCGAVHMDTNPNTRWDWWMFGGRFDGRVSGQPPERMDRLHRIMMTRAGVPQTRDDGTVVVEFLNNEEWDRCLSDVQDELYRANVVPVSELPTDLVCQVIVTPDGEWHKVGTWDRDEPEQLRREWDEKRRSLLAAHQDCLAVACDIHEGWCSIVAPAR